MGDKYYMMEHGAPQCIGFCAEKSAVVSGSTSVNDTAPSKRPHCGTWVKVTHGAMPPDREFVMVTYELPTKERICSECKKICCVDGKWVEYVGGDHALEIERDYPCKVTHWMPYPTPANE